MRAAGVICEFDPFHSGHRYLLESARKALKPDAVVCVMSGAFTQRGEPAMWDKFSRAKAAVLCGADLVLELPSVFVLGSAGYFAAGGTGVLVGLGCVSHLAFGSECGSAERLISAAKAGLSESSGFSAALKDALAMGLSYPAAYEEAAKSCGLEGFSELFTGPNDVLAISYIRELLKLEEAGFGHVEPFAVKRLGAGHAEMSESGGTASGSYIRWLSQDAYGKGASQVKEALSGLVPEAALEVLTGPSALFMPDRQKYFSMVVSRILSASPEELSALPEVSEGLESRIKQAAMKASSFEELVLSVKTKRYTYARICRSFAALLLGADRLLVQRASKNAPYSAKVLAFNEQGAKILRYAQQRGIAPVLSNINKNPVPEGIHSELLEKDILANDLYSILCGRPPAEFSDKVRIPIIIRN